MQNNVNHFTLAYTGDIRDWYFQSFCTRDINLPTTSSIDIVCNIIGAYYNIAMWSMNTGITRVWRLVIWPALTHLDHIRLAVVIMPLIRYK